jgi:tetraacyldisaccharide-1-P 4'-kinase
MSVGARITARGRRDEPGDAVALIDAVGWVYARGARARRAWYARHPEARHRLTRPVVSVGNLRVGGSGKTPLVRHLAVLLRQLGEHPAILSRGFARAAAEDGVVVVSDGLRIRADLGRSGDEPLMLARALAGVGVFVSADRYLAGLLAERRFGATVHILDDGFQHFALERQADLLLVSDDDLDGGRTLPFGRLREPAGAAAAADAIIRTSAGASATAGGAVLPDGGPVVPPAGRAPLLPAPGPAGAPGGGPAVLPDGGPVVPPAGRAPLLPAPGPAGVPGGGPAVVPGGGPAVPPAGGPAVLAAGAAPLPPSGPPGLPPRGAAFAAWDVASAGARPHQPVFTLRREIGVARLVEGGDPVAAGSARAMMVAGIARPERFRRDLEQAGWQLAGERLFGDHERFLPATIAEIGRAAAACGAGIVLTTEKDLARLLRFRPLPVPVAWVPLEVAVEPAAEFRAWLVERLSLADAPAKNGAT